MPIKIFNYNKKNNLDKTNNLTILTKFKLTCDKTQQFKL